MIVTGRYQYRSISDDTHHAIRTTRGAPRFPLKYSLHDTAWDIAPPREAFGLGIEEFRRVYFAHLDAIGADAIIRLLDGYERRAGGKPVVLLCFCDMEPGEEGCHRHLFAEWFEKQTGVAIPEMKA